MGKPAKRPSTASQPKSPRADAPAPSPRQGRTAHEKLDKPDKAKAAKPVKPDKAKPVSDKTPAKTKPDKAIEVAPLAPPPRPGSLSLEPNVFEQSFGGNPALPDTPAANKLPPLATLTSPQSILPGSGTTPFNWGGGSLRSGPLSPAMLSGPATDYFGDAHNGFARGFPTPNESSLRTGLTPGGSGSMFPAQSPSANLFGMPSGGATPSTLDFHRTALSAAAANRDQPKAPAPSRPQPAAVTSQPADGASAPAPAPADPDATDHNNHANDAANSLYLLANSRNGSTASAYPAVSTTNPASVAGSTSPRTVANEASALPSRAASDGSASEEGDSPQPVQASPQLPLAKGKGKTAPPAPMANGRRKADEAPAKGPVAKKARASNGTAVPLDDDDDDDSDGSKRDDEPRRKMTDEEKRKNFLERNRVAALKCRQRKKQWLASLQNKVEIFTTENENLALQVSHMRDEIMNLKQLLALHKDCSVTRAQGALPHTAPFPLSAVEPFASTLNVSALGGQALSGPALNGAVLAGPLNGYAVPPTMPPPVMAAAPRPM